MPNFLRLLLGLALLPACWGVTRVTVDSVVAAANRTDADYLGALCFLGGMASFLLCWFFLPRLVRTYVLGHELTHALWGLLFGAVPTKLRVSAKGGSVNLSKSNLLITLAPYFFPFYTFVVILAALAVYAFRRPLPFVPGWLFLIGLTWSFHVLYTLETLSQRQPDVTTYGRVFSWTFIYLANLLTILVGLAAVTSLTFGGVWSSLLSRVGGAYRGIYGIMSSYVP